MYINQAPCCETFIPLTDGISHGKKKSDKIEIPSNYRIPGHFKGMVGVFLPFLDYLLSINIIPILCRKAKLNKTEILTKFLLYHTEMEY